MTDINNISMTIFPELNNHIDPPRTYFSDNQIKIKVIELVSLLFEEKMGELFNQGQLLVFLNYKKQELSEMVRDLILYYNNYEPNEEENTDKNLEDSIIENIDYIGNIEEWIWEFVI